MPAFPFGYRKEVSVTGIVCENKFAVIKNE